MTETCIEIIDRLEEEGKSVFILEDLHLSIRKLIHF